METLLVSKILYNNVKEDIPNKRFTINLNKTNYKILFIDNQYSNNS